MLEAVFTLARPLLNVLDPENAHELTLRSLEAGIYPRGSAPDDSRLAARCIIPIAVANTAASSSNGSWPTTASAVR